jgi:putative sigma-54 modulation protein
MDLVVKGRGVRITDQLRRVAERKLERLSRIEPRAVRVEVEVISEHHPRQDGTKRLEATLTIPRRTFRARAEGPDVEVALDRLVDRLERLVRDYRGRVRGRIMAGANRLKAARAGPGPTEAAE